LPAAASDHKRWHLGRNTFSAFKHRNYRLFSPASSSLSGTAVTVGSGAIVCALAALITLIIVRRRERELAAQRSET
jgi:hypothetical protein